MVSPICSVFFSLYASVFYSAVCNAQCTTGRYCYYMFHWIGIFYVRQNLLHSNGLFVRILRVAAIWMVNLGVWIFWRWFQMSINRTHYRTFCINFFRSDQCAFNTQCQWKWIPWHCWSWQLVLSSSRFVWRWKLIERDRNDSVACVKSHHLLISPVSIAILKHYNLSSFAIKRT